MYIFSLIFSITFVFYNVYAKEKSNSSVRIFKVEEKLQKGTKIRMFIIFEKNKNKVLFKKKTQGGINWSGGGVVIRCASVTHAIFTMILCSNFKLIMYPESKGFMIYAEWKKNVLYL